MGDNQDNRYGSEGQPTKSDATGSGTTTGSSYSTGSSIGSGGYGTGSNLGATGSGSSSSAGVGSTSSNSLSSQRDSSFGTTTASELGGMSAGIISLLERFGVQETQLNAVRETLQNVKIEDHLDKAKEQVNESIGKARQYAKENPGAVLAGLAVLVIGAGLIAGAVKRNQS